MALHDQAPQRSYFPLTRLPAEEYRHALSEGDNSTILDEIMADDTETPPTSALKLKM